MKRWHEDWYVSLREWRKHRRSHVESNKRRIVREEGDVGIDPWNVDCPCDDQVGRFRKKDAWDCGIPHCRICHGNKYPKREKSRQELESEFSFKEQLMETETSREEHLAWCKERALAYCEPGMDPTDAFASMASDLGKHSETRSARTLMETLGMGLLMGGHLSTPTQMREFIEGFN
jgi:hypothetical protein